MLLTPLGERNECWRRLAGTARPGMAGTSGPEVRSRRLPLSAWRASRWTVTSQRPRTHPQARTDGWRYVAKRSAAIAAQFSHGVSGPQPVASGGALRIDALNGPSRQILHAFSPSGMTRCFFRSRPTFPALPLRRAANSEPLRSPEPETRGKTWRECALMALWCQEKRYNK